jgi:ribulose 1,5-bisphosphate carboxylase large subunit-like protein
MARGGCINTEEGILATYYIETSDSLDKVAESIAEIETTGEWVGTSRPTDLFEKCVGKVYEVHEYEKGKGTVTIFFPIVNMDLENAAFADLWLTMVGGGTFDMTTYTKSRLMDISLPAKVLRHFPGPKFGIERTRECLGLKEGEPIIGMIIKPTSGLSPEDVAKMCYEAALGGIRFIKDDEKMLNPQYCPLDKRVEAVVKALKKAEEKTGLKVLYAPHITADYGGIIFNAKTALSKGANALMINFFASGFTSLKRIAEDPDIDVPIYAHCGGRSVLSRAEGQGIDPMVIAKLARICGGDYFRAGALNGYLVGALNEMKSISRALREKMPFIKDAVPVVSGGLSAFNIGKNLDVFGVDTLYLAGSSILKHSMGIKAGVKAIIQAAEAHACGIPINIYAKDHEELKAAIANKLNTL